jgi:hypothetical protein
MYQFAPTSVRSPLPLTPSPRSSNLLATPDERYVDTFTKSARAYLEKVRARFTSNTHDTRAGGLSSALLQAGCGPTCNYPGTIHVDFLSSGLRRYFGNNLSVEPVGVVQMARRAFSMSLCPSREATQPAER